jgi:hypothetical protein
MKTIDRVIFGYWHFYVGLYLAWKAWFVISDLNFGDGMLFGILICKLLVNLLEYTGRITYNNFGCRD